MKKILSAVAALAILVTTCCADVPAQEYEHLTHTKLTPWLSNYHMTTVEQIEKGVAGGEGFQIIYSSAISDTNPDYMLRGYDTSGIYYSHNGGEHWYPAESGINNCIERCEFYPGNENICFAVTKGYANINAGVYKSEDGGKNWRRTFAMPYAYTILSTPIVFATPEKEGGDYTMYVAVSKAPANSIADLKAGNLGIFKSTDCGETFTNVGFPDKLVSGLYANPEYDFVIACVNEQLNADQTGTELINGGLYVSYDGGSTWQPKNKGVEDLPIRCVTVNPVNPNEWIMSPDICSIDGYITETVEDTVSLPSTNPNDNIVPLDISTEASTTVNEVKVAYGVPMLYKSMDKGETWSRMEVNWNGAGDESIDGTRPIDTQRYTKIRTLYYTWPDENGEQALIADMNATDQPCRISYDGGSNFIGISSYNYVYFSAGYAAVAVATTKANPNLIMWNLLRSDNKGKFMKGEYEANGWKWINSGISGGAAVNFDWDSNGQIRYIGLFDVALMKKAEGYEGDFPPIERPSDFPSVGGSRTISAVAVDPNDENHVFAVTGAAEYAGRSTIVETFDGFKSYRYYTAMLDRLDEKIEAGNGEAYNIRKIYYSPTDDNVVYSSWFVSEDNGKTWRESEREIKAVDSFDGDVVYAVDKNEIYISYDRARTWESTGITLGAVEYGVSADIFEPYVLWCGRHSTAETTVYRVDLKTGKIKTFGASNGIAGPRETGLQLGAVAQSPVDPNMLAVGGRDYFSDSTYVFISKDGGEHFELIEGAPPNGMGTIVKFHPTKKQLWWGSHQGTMVLDYEKYFAREATEE